MARRKRTRPKAQFPPPFSTPLPELADQVEKLRGKISSFVQSREGRRVAQTPQAYLDAFHTKDIVTAADMERLQRLERQQTHMQLHEIDGSPPHIRRGGDTLERILAHEAITFLGHIQNGFGLALGLSGESPKPDLRFDYELVGGSIVVPKLEQALRNPHAGAEKIRPHIREEPIFEISAAGGALDLARIYGQGSSIIQFDQSVNDMRDAMQQYAAQGADDAPVMDLTRHNFIARNTDSILGIFREPTRTLLRQRRGGRNSLARVEEHFRLKRSGGNISHSYARKYAEYLAGDRSSIYDMMAMRLVADEAVIPHAMTSYLYHIHKNPAYWKRRGSVIAHSFRHDEEAKAQELFTRGLRKDEPLRFMTHIAAGMDGEGQTEDFYGKPRHIEVLLPVTGIAGPERQPFEMNIALQVYTPAWFDASITRKGVRHDEYKARQIVDFARHATPATLAMYAILCGLTDFPGILEPAQMPIAQIVYETAVRHPSPQRR